MKKLIEQGIESISLTLFLLYIHIAEMNTRADWLLPYLLATSAGVVATVYLYRRGLLLNRLLVGINLYFFSGLIGLLSGWDWLNNLYGQLGAAAMLGWILVTGISASLFSPYGFLAVTIPGYFSLKRGSLLLLLATLLAFITALSFIGSKLFGEWLPFIFLFSMRSLLLQLDKKWLSTPATTG